MEDLIIAIVALACIGLGVFLAPYLQKYLQKKNIDVPQFLDQLEVNLAVIGEVIINRALKDKDAKDKASRILDIVTSAINELNDSIQAKTDEQKVNIIYTTSVRELNKLGIALDQYDKDLIEILAKSALNLVKK